MTKILYNRAVKTFINAISQGFDEHGAYDKVEKKHGKVLADAVWAEAQAEMKAMKKNPRGAKTDMALRSLINVDYAAGRISKAERDARLKEVKENPREYLEISKTDPKHIIKVTPIQLKILIKAHKQKHGEFHPQSETQARNIARLKEKGLFYFIVDKELHLSVYKLSVKGHKLISEYLSHRGVK